MAEFTHVGQQCEVSECKQLDFLPFQCSFCSKVFCLEHKFPDSHDCSKCNVSDRPTPNCALPSFHKCSVVQCTADGVEVIICDRCNAHVCLKHRHSSDHKCLEEKEVEKVSKTEEVVNKILASRAEVAPKAKAKLSTKGEKMAAKLALMKLKMKAVGEKNVILENRVYLLVFLPKNSGQQSKALYFHKALKVGKVIDKLADSYDILNRNNRPGDKRLALFYLSDGHRLPVGRSLEDLVTTEEIFDGSSVVLEHTDSACTHLENLEHYHS